MEKSPDVPDSCAPMATGEATFYMDMPENTTLVFCSKLFSKLATNCEIRKNCKNKNKVHRPPYTYYLDHNLL